MAQQAHAGEVDLGQHGVQMCVSVSGAFCFLFGWFLRFFWLLRLLFFVVCVACFFFLSLLLGGGLLLSFFFYLVLSLGKQTRATSAVPPSPVFFVFGGALCCQLRTWNDMLRAGLPLARAGRSAAARTAVRGAAAAFLPQSGGMRQRVFCPTAIPAVVPGTRELPFFPGCGQLRRLSTALPGTGKAITEDPTLSAANTALDDAKAMLTHLEEKRVLAQAKQERDAAMKKRDAAMKMWQDKGEPSAGVYFDSLSDARSAVTDAQSAVTDARSTVNKLLLAAAGNGSNGNEYGKLSTDDPVVMSATAMWRGLRETDVKPHTTVFPDLEVLDEYGVPFDFNVLEVPGPLPFAAEPTAKSTVVERDFYPLVQDIANEHAGSRYRVLLRGAPGIGKSGALGAYLLHAMGQRMNQDGEQCPVQQVVLTSPQSRCYAYRQDGTVDVWTQPTAEVLELALQSDSVWLMDEKEHGPVLDAMGVTFLLASADPENYDTYWKKSQRLCFIPTWDSDGRLSDQGLPLELEALVRVMLADQTSDVTVPEAVKHYNVCGAFPRDIVEDFPRARNQIDFVIDEASLEDTRKITTRRKDLVTLHVDHRLGTPAVDRETLEANDQRTFVIASPYVRQQLLAKQTAGDWEQTLAVYKTQAQVSGSRTGVGKMFEELAFHYLAHVNGEVTARRLDHDVAETETLRVCPEGAEVGTVTTFKQDLRGRQPYVFKSDNRTEGGIDFLCATDEGDLTAINVTLNKNHDMKAIHIAQRLEAQHPTDAATMKFLWLTDQVTEPQMKVKKMVIKDMSDKKKMAARNEMLGRVEQWVATLPVDFADYIRYDQVAPAAEETTP